MDVFDTNVWVCALTSQNTTAETLVDEVVQNSREVAVDAYIFQEVLDAFDNSYKRNKANRHKNDFGALVANNKSISGPSQSAVSQMDVNRVRSSNSIRLIATSFSIQAKDAPILCLAYEFRSTSPTVFTCDGPFSKCDPSNHNLPNISIQHI